MKYYRAYIRSLAQIYKRNVDRCVNFDEKLNQIKYIRAYEYDIR